MPTIPGQVIKAILMALREDTRNLEQCQLTPERYLKVSVCDTRVNGAPVSDSNPLPVDCLMVNPGTWQTIISVRLDDDPTSYNSPTVDVSDWSALWVLIWIDSTLAPTNVRILPQFTPDSGANWYDFEEGLWASLYWEDTDTASGIYKAFLLPCGGIDQMRIRAVGTGTDATNYFDVTVMVRGFRGNFGMGHA